jgi:DNA-binding CsgD family transcriptional regulator
MDLSSASFDSLESCLSESALKLYREALRAGSLDSRNLSTDSMHACRALLECGLLRPDPANAHFLRPNSPNLLVGAFSVSLHQDIQKRFALAARLYGALSTLCSVYSDNVHHDDVPLSIEYLQSVSEVHTALTNAVMARGGTVISIHSGGSSSLTAVNETIECDLAMIAHGGRVRSLFQHSARTRGGAANLVAKLVRAGGEVRTLARTADRMIIFDRSCVFLSASPGKQNFDSAVVVREPTMVAHLLAVAREKWEAGVAFDPNSYRKGLDEAITDIQRSVLYSLASGAKDETAARDLGMSVRTFRRHLATVMDTLGAVSRFHAAVLANEAGLLRS